MKKIFCLVVLTGIVALLLPACVQTETTPVTSDENKESAAAVTTPVSSGENSETVGTESAVTAESAGYQTITPAEAKERIGQDGVVLLDVRTAEEYSEQHIEGAILLPVDEIAEKAGSVLPDKTATIIVYCRSGNRSAVASRLLVGMGYKNVYNMGGISDWPYETVTGE